MKRRGFTPGSLRIRTDALDRLRDAVSGARALGKRTTLEGMTTLGLILAARMLEARYNAGAKFQRRPKNLPLGRFKRRVDHDVANR